MHAKAVDQKGRAPDYFSDFLAWVRAGIGLPADKARVFEGLCQFPLSTNSLCTSIFFEHEKVFTAEDSYFDVHLHDDSLKAEMEAFIQKEKVRDVFRKMAFDVYCRRPASLVVVDLPAVQEGPRPEPYFYTVSIDNLLDIEIEKTKDAERVSMVIFKAKQGIIVQIDDSYYRVLQKVDNGDDYTLIIETPHGLGYTPACFVPKHPLYDAEDNSPVARRTILSNVLADLDWLQFWKVAERMVNTYGPFPIWTVPKTDCDFVAHDGTPCKGGFIASVNRHGDLTSSPCPVCEKNNLVGPGTVYEKPVPKTKDQPELGKAVDITTPEVGNLEYIAGRTDFLEWEIYANCVGSADETITKEAVNEKQVQVNADSKKNVLQSLAREFEAAEKFIIDTIGRLMFGDYYVACTINYGENFMLYTPGEAVEQYLTWKKAGLPAFMVHQKKTHLIQAQNRNNPYEQRRADVLNLLEPWSDLSLTEVVSLQLASIFPEKFALKLDFAKFVSKFEVINGDIVQWGSALTLDQKLQRITKILFSYVSEETAGARKPESDNTG